MVIGIDPLSASVRTLSFVALFQAAGIAIFVAIFGRSLGHSARRIRKLGWISAIVAIIAVSAHTALEAARLAGDLAGMLDASLQRMVLQSSIGTMLALRIAGLFLIAVSIQGRWRLHANVALLGAFIALASFAVTGHTSVHPDRPMLAILLLTHLFAAAFWFGSLTPLYLVSAHESMRVAGQILDAFSAIALWLVPGLLVIGILMATLLLPSSAALRMAYGKLLIGKVVGFALLMLLAAANKWRYSPAIKRGEAPAIASFQRSVTIEAALIIAVLSITAVMTGFFSPDP
jgi:putative copper resistance protein D